MANVMFDEKTLYYQYMINNNPTSTMLNSISGNYGNDGFGAMGSLGALGSLGGVSSFSSILENYLTGMKLNFMRILSRLALWQISCLLYWRRQGKRRIPRH